MTGTDLVARTRRLPADRVPDLLAVAGADGTALVRSGRGLAGFGRAWRGPRGDLAAVLAAIDVDDEVGLPGSGPVAVGAVPFLASEPTVLTIPEVLVVDGEDGAWITTVAADGGGPDARDLDGVLALAAARPERPAPSEAPSSFTVAAARPPADWEAAVAAATARIRAGELDKVVLAREITVTADRDISAATVLGRLVQHYPGCYLYLVDGFLGATPELLVARRDDVVRAQPMAGTAPRRGDPDTDAELSAALFASETYRREHQVTIDEVRDTLLGFSSYVDYQPEPSVVPLANVFHLASLVEGRLSHPPAPVLELVDALHPTPAVCGRPRDAALAVIAELEDLDRGRYAGAVGWTDAAGNGEWAVAIRGAELDGPTARVIAGNGMVGDSDPPTELIETRAKLNAVLSALVRP